MGDRRPRGFTLSLDSATAAPTATVTNSSTTTVSLVGLGLVAWGVASEDPFGLGGHGLASLLLFVVAGLGWLGWRYCLYLPHPRLHFASLLTMALAGGVLSVDAPTALVFVGVAALGAALRWPMLVAGLVALTGPAAVLATVLVDGAKDGVAVSGAAAAMTGAVLGATRRQGVERAQQAAEVEVAAARADAEEARAELLAGRNHLARELHDVLAHSLSALSIRLEALDTLLGDQPAAVRQELDATKRLVREGLTEARGAVRALREDMGSLESELQKLADERHAELSVEGTPRRLTADVALAVYRVAQEALTNAGKHAPGAHVAVRLGYRTDGLALTVENSPPSGPPVSDELGSSGAGFGLQGIRERVLLLGGHVEARPNSGGWLVETEIPT